MNRAEERRREVALEIPLRSFRKCAHVVGLEFDSRDDWAVDYPGEAECRMADLFTDPDLRSWVHSRKVVEKFVKEWLPEECFDLAGLVAIHRCETHRGVQLHVIPTSAGAMVRLSRSSIWDLWGSSEVVRMRVGPSATVRSAEELEALARELDAEFSRRFAKGLQREKVNDLRMRAIRGQVAVRAPELVDRVEVEVGDRSARILLPFERVTTTSGAVVNRRTLVMRLPGPEPAKWRDGPLDRVLEQAARFDAAWRSLVDELGPDAVRTI